MGIARERGTNPWSYGPNNPLTTIRSIGQLREPIPKIIHGRPAIIPGAAKVLLVAAILFVRDLAGRSLAFRDRRLVMAGASIRINRFISIPL
jgi:hypothetical protein